MVIWPWYKLFVNIIEPNTTVGGASGYKSEVNTEHFLKFSHFKNLTYSIESQTGFITNICQP